jgi:DNA primase large subunit
MLLSDLIANPYSSIARLKAALNRTDFESEDDSSYAGARILASCLRRASVYERLADFEARNIDFDSRYEELCQQLNVRFEDTMSIIEFVPIVARMHDSSLLNYDVYQGRVTITQDDKVEMLKQHFKATYVASLPLRIPKCVKDALDPYIKELRESIVNGGSATFDILKLPPCILSLVSKASNGEQICHTGRFALASFLFATGIGRDDIIDLFGGNRSVVEYQVNHIINTEYTVPSCANLRSAGVCCAKCDVKNPLNYYRIDEDD